MARKHSHKSLLGGGGGLLSGSRVLLLEEDDLGLHVVVLPVVLGLGDLDEVWHDLLLSADLNLGTLHDLDLKTEDTLTELDGTDSSLDEIELRLTSGDLVTLDVLLGLCALATDLTGNENFATDGTTTAHDGTKDVVGGHTDGVAGEKLELKVLDVGGGGQVSVVRELLDGEVNLVVAVVEVVSLLDEGLDLLHLTGGLVGGKEILSLGATHADLGVDAAATFYLLIAKQILEK